MKQKPKTSLSPLQRKRLFRISCGLVVVALLWLVFAPGRGFFYLHRQGQYLAELKEENREMVQENSDITRDIERLQTDKEYLEKVAREKHGMVKDNEMIFDFSKKKKE